MESDLYSLIMNSALRYVSIRPRSEKEMRDFIQKKIQKMKLKEEDLLDRVLERLKELEYINDRKFVQWWMRSRASNKPKGKRILVLELSQKGVQKDVIEEVFASSETTSENEENQAKKAVEKKMMYWGKLPTIEQKKKLYDFLIRRGFSYDVVKRVVDGILLNKIQ